MSFSKLHKDSNDSASSQLDLFATPFTQTSILNGDWVELGPIRDSTNGPLEFEIESTDDQYLDLQNTLITLQCKVLKSNGAALGEGNGLTIMPSTYFLHSLFSTVSVTINGHEVEYESNYPYRAYLESLVNYGAEAKRTHLSMSLWHDDKGGVIDTDGIVDGNKALFKPRKDLVAKSRTLDMIGRFHSDLFHQHKYLPPSCKVSVKLIRSDPKFCLQKTASNDNDEYKVDIIRCELLVRKVKVNPGVITKHNELLASGVGMKYPTKRIQTQFFSISQGKQSERLNLILNRQQPKRLLISLVDHTAKNGSYTTNPFNFKHFHLSSIGLVVDGHPVPNKPIRLDFDNNLYTRAYANLLLASGKAFVDEDNSITTAEFANGFAIYAFDLTGDLCEGEGVHLVKQSTTSLELDFKKALEQTISVFVYSEYDDLLEIDRNRIVTRASKV